MLLDQIAVIFVFIGNAASIILLVFMLFKILRQTEATHQLLIGGTQDLLEAGKRLRDSMQATDRLVDRLTDINSQADAAPAPGQASMAPAGETEEHLRRIEDMISDLSGRKLQDHSKFLEDIRSLLDSLTGVKTDGFNEWRQTNQAKLDTALAQRNRLATEMEALKVRLDDSNKIIQELRRSVRLAEAAGQSADALRASLDQHQQLLARAKERTAHAEAKVASLSKEIELIQADAAKGDAKDGGAATNSLKRQLEAIMRERDGLNNQLDKLREAMQRTLIEKDFIEGKLLDMDAALPRVNASATSADQPADEADSGAAPAETTAAATHAP